MTTPFYTDDWLTLYGGDCRDVLAGLPADSVDCVVTSPPYWGLRDYGTATWDGGDAECDHKAPPSGGTVKGSTLVGSGNREGFSVDGQYRQGCARCGAVRIDSQLGLERTPEEYVANMVAVFAEVRRVLKPSGTCWLNLGDSYSSGLGEAGSINEHWGNPVGQRKQEHAKGRPPYRGLPPKNLVGIPWRVAFALQADGWYLRSDIIWSKPNPMPESVTDRPTKSHEYLFLLTKQPRYYFDADAVREPNVEPTSNGGWQNAIRQGDPDRYQGRYIPNKTEGGAGGSKFMRGEHVHTGGRNIRSVWNIATRPYPGAHFAVFPPELPERCIKAGSSEKGVCPKTGVYEIPDLTDGIALEPEDIGIDPKTIRWHPTCGRPWERVVARPDEPEGLRNRGNGAKLDYHTRQTGSGQKLQDWMDANPKQTTGWRPTCDHDAAPAPAVVLDPFGGSGTVGMVANRLSRRAILIDLNPEYLKQQMRRNAQTPLGLTEGDAA
jgi:DNA modification methylase